VSDEVIKTVIAVTFVLSGTLAREVGDRDATEFEILCGLSICRAAVRELLENPKRNEEIVNKAMERIRLIVDQEALNPTELH
jgi:hypothetical protein